MDAETFNPRTRSLRSVLRRRRLLLAGSIPFLGFITALLAFWLMVWFSPYPQGWSAPPPASVWIEDRLGKPLGVFISSDGNWQLPLNQSQISPHLLAAIVAVEDQRFYQHAGVDWKSVIGAAWDDLSHCRAHRGASTLTMQLQRLRDPRERTFENKFVQAVRAEQIERVSTKSQILIEYLNRAPFGGNLIGAGAASWRYFGKACSDLSLGQAALLAGLPQSPSRFRPDRHPELARVRRNHVLQRMLAVGMITPDQLQIAETEPIDASWHPLPQEMNLEDGLNPTLNGLAENHPGASLRLTIDADTQHRVAMIARRSLTALAESHVAGIAVVVLDTPSANCLAAASLTQSQPGNSNELDLTRCSRSSGSTLKPFIYATAFDMGLCTPTTMLDDVPQDWNGYVPGNYDRQFRGRLPAGEALAQSRNLPAINLLWRVGVEREVGVLKSAGFSSLARSPERFGLPLAVGGAEVTPMELAEAYATLARGGIHRKLRLIVDGNDPSTDPIDNALNETSCESVRWQTMCFATLACLADPARTAEVFPGAAAIGPAWKTGTSSGHRDAWCVAATPRKTVVVWLGNPDGSSSSALVGSTSAAPIALQILAACDSVTGSGFDDQRLAGHATLPSSTIALFALPPVLQMISPADGAIVIHDGSIPMDQQRCELKAQTSTGTNDTLWWFVDQKCVGKQTSGGSLWWIPEAGEHRVKVIDAAGHVAEARVVVRGE